MVSSGLVPWNETPAREFPVKRWLAQRYGFTVSSQVFARQAQQSAGPTQQRRFPALVWVEERQAGGAC